MQDIKQNLNSILNKIRETEIKTGRKENSVKLMAVSKFHSCEEIETAIKSGQILFGENRVQEASEKFPSLFSNYPDINLHMIGVLQTNKVLNAVKIASCIQSVDSIKLLKEIEKQSAKLNKNMNILFELHTGEESKSGFTDLDELKKAFDLCEEGLFPHITPCGFMTMAPFTQDKSIIHSSFKTAYEISQKFKSEYKNFNLQELSMGMSGDFEIAIEEGSTLVRVGTAIFGERDYTKK